MTESFSLLIMASFLHEIIFEKKIRNIDKYIMTLLFLVILWMSKIFHKEGRFLQKVLIVISKSILVD
jgi:hypothetical protein